ncbi:hypothetical protein J6590_008772 [Homalodisca vitripennis]|nr:hypothetical protein J6590_008772 [Homalodisca vitripennis]
MDGYNRGCSTVITFWVMVQDIVISSPKPAVWSNSRDRLHARELRRSRFSERVRYAIYGPNILPTGQI